MVVTFIPFIVDLAAEFGMLREIDFESLSVVLLDNATVTKRFNKQPSMKLVEESLPILVHLKEKGYVQTREIGEMVNVFTYRGLNQRIYSSLKGQFDS